MPAIEHQFESTDEIHPPAGRVFWRRGQPPPFRLGIISSILQAGSWVFSNALYGEGLRWRVGSKVSAVILEFFPNRGHLRLRLPIDPTNQEFQDREYPAESLAVYESDFEPMLLVQSSLGHHHSILFLSARGDIDEQLRSQKTTTDYVQVGSRSKLPVGSSDLQVSLPNKFTVTVPNAAMTLGVSKSYIQRLARNGELLATKVGRNWWVSAEDLALRVSSKSHER